MTFNPQPPPGSAIQVATRDGQLELSWLPPAAYTHHLPAVRDVRVKVAAWALAVALGVVFLVLPPIGARTGLAALWLYAWGLLGPSLWRDLQLMTRGTQPERLVLGVDQLTHQTGHIPTLSGKELMPLPLVLPAAPRTFSRAGLPPLRLEYGDDSHRQRLWYNDGESRVEVGEWLSEDEREWLADLIGAWRKAGAPYR